MKELILYVHGKGGSAEESEHYRSLFSDCEVVGLDYRTFTPWETGKEIREAAEGMKAQYGKITMIANSIGAYFSMHSGVDTMLHRAFFISPIVNMEQLILNMMSWAGVTESDLAEKGIISTPFGEDLSWEYLCWVRGHPIRWDVPTEILYGGHDMLTSLEAVSDFARKHNAGLTVMEDGEHWFHTDEQMRFLDDWLRDCLFMARPLEGSEIESALGMEGTPMVFEGA